MSIFYQPDTKTFTLETANTRYSFQLVYGKYPTHLSYGARDDSRDVRYHCNYRSFSPYPNEEIGMCFSPDNNALEYSTFGHGDFRATALRIRNADGNSVTGLEYRSHQIIHGREQLPGLPFAEADEHTDTLILRMTDPATGVDAELCYTVFENDDVISRYIRVINNGEHTVTIEKCMSLMLDLDNCDYDMITLYGGHMWERNYQRTPLFHGSQSICSRRGASSHQFNPFLALCSRNATHTEGEVYGFNFVYSGNFLDEVEVDQCNATRVLMGLGSENFNYLLNPGETFCSPEAVMTYTDQGIGQMSRNFHRFIRSKILPREIFNCRPVVLNTWEACYFDINENELLRFSEAARDAGIDMVVMDDGWFGARDDDRSSLGDWFVNAPKFRNGLKAFVDKVKSFGIKFGIWIEPEMINPVSKLYEAHPDWCLQVPGRDNHLSRHQLVLDMANPDVIAYLKDIFSRTFDGVAIDYFKWDMNRHLSEVGSTCLPPHRQGEAAYRHMLGVYELFSWFREKYPHAMIENCSGGGGRYDLGMMKYSTMIWTSDNTNPGPRIKIQYGSMLAYPAATMSCHVSRPETLEDLDYRFHVALGGALGYELHLPNASEAVKARIREQVREYRQYEDLILRGDYYPLMNPFTDVGSAYYYTDPARRRFLLSFLQTGGNAFHTFKLSIGEADPGADYYDTIGGQRYTGSQLRAGIPVTGSANNRYSRMWHFVKE